MSINTTESFKGAYIYMYFYYATLLKSEQFHQLQLISINFFTVLSSFTVIYNEGRKPYSISNVGYNYELYNYLHSFHTLKQTLADS